MKDSQIGRDMVRNRLPDVVYPGLKQIDGWIKGGAWVDISVGDAMHARAAQSPDAPSFISDERCITFSELDAQSDRAAAALLELGFDPGDRIVVQIGTTIETVIAVVALFKAGLIPVCAIPQYREVEIGQLIALTRARGHLVQADYRTFDLAAFADRMRAQFKSVKHVVTLRGSRPEIGPDLLTIADAVSQKSARLRLRDVPIGSADVLSFQLSGGTTGVPKIIPRFHGEYLAHSRGGMMQFGFGPDDRMIWPFPLLHNAGQVYAVIPPLIMGSSTVILPKLDIPKLFSMIEKHAVTHAISIGPAGAQILNYHDLHKHNLKSLRMFATMSGSQSLEAHLGIPCANLYGITEGLLLGSLPSDSAKMRHTSNGASGVHQDEIRLINPSTGELAVPGEEGELTFRGASSLKGYYGNAAATAEVLDEHGFFRSGDIVRPVSIGDRICYAFQGRTRDNVNRGGEKIGCEEVEEFAARHPAVAEARLVAMPDPIYSEKGCVFVILRRGAEAPTVAGLGAFLVDQGLAKFKCPERVEVIDVFPVTRVGKLDRAELRTRIRELLASEAESQVPNQLCRE